MGEILRTRHPRYRLQQPFDVWFEHSPEPDEIILHVRTPAGWARRILDVLETLTQLGEALRKESDAAERDIRIAEILKQRGAEHREIRWTYGEYRKAGLLHRAAIRACIADPRHASQHLTFTEVNACVRNRWGEEPLPGTRRFEVLHPKEAAALRQSASSKRKRTTA